MELDKKQPRLKKLVVRGKVKFDFCKKQPTMLNNIQDSE